MGPAGVVSVPEGHRRLNDNLNQIDEGLRPGACGSGPPSCVL